MPKPERIERAAKILAAMPPDQRSNAERLGYVVLEMRSDGRSLECDTEQISPAILAAESSLRSQHKD